MKNLPEKIKTIASESEFRLKEKGSTFISLSTPIEKDEDAVKFLSSLKKKYYDATHYCYSYRFVDGSFKYSDDGEPSGTAGKRILNAQNHFEVTNLITMVVRYFGGTKLGIGPLGKAYYESAFQCLKSSNLEHRILHNRIEIRYEFEFSNLIHHITSKYSLIIENNIYEPHPIMVCSIPHSTIDKFASELTSSSNNLVSLRELNESYYVKR